MSHGYTARTIRRVLRKKMSDWASSVKDEDVKKTISDNALVAGGAIASMLLGESPKDYDVYFRTPEAAMQVGSYYADELKQLISMSQSTTPAMTIEVRSRGDDGVKVHIQSAGAASSGDNTNYRYFELMPDRDMASEWLDQIVESKGSESSQIPLYSPVFATSSAITLSGDIQVCLPFTGTPDQIISSFDFVHAQLAYDYASNELHIERGALQALLAKELVYTGTTKYPLASVFRLRKFLQRGFRINAGQLLKLAFDIHELNLADPEVLEDQLTGVDIAYFAQIISEIKESGRDIDSTYIAELVDRIF